jgi:uncharacterized protein YggE
MLFTQEQKPFVSHLLLAALVLLVIFLGVLSINTLKKTKYIGTGGNLPNTLTFTGNAEVRVEPDMANISFSVDEENEDVTQAQEVVSAKISNILERLQELGINTKDIRTSSYSTNPRYDWNEGERILTGYVARQNIDLIVRNIEDTSLIVGLLGEADVTNMSGPYFEIEDEEKYERIARRDAIAAAKEKAEELAEDLGVKLIRIVSFGENGGMDYPQPYDYAESLSFDGSVQTKQSVPSPEIPSGESIISATITITYEVQ